MALEIQNSSEENKRIIEKVQNTVHKDKQIFQDLVIRGEKLDQEVHEAFIKVKPISNIQEEETNKLNKTVCICIWITIIAIIMTIIIVIVYLTTSLSSNTLHSSTTSTLTSTTTKIRISTTESGPSDKSIVS